MDLISSFHGVKTPKKQARAYFKNGRTPLLCVQAHPKYSKNYVSCQFVAKFPDFWEFQAETMQRLAPTMMKIPV